MKAKIYNKSYWFTLIEVIVWVLITTTLILIWFQALSAITIWKVKLIDSTNIEKETFFFVQKLFEEIKKWWTTDYEEYFNRSVVWNTTYLSWHYLEETWFWNFWNNWSIWSTTYWDTFYYCRSWNWVQMWTWWCVNNYNNPSLDYTWKPQRYGQYSFQFIDYNSNYDDDLWDEDWDGSIIWDDDDEYLGEGPSVFTWSTDVKELYLISADKKKRTLFRWSVKQDPYIDSSVYDCNSVDWKTFTWTWCLGTIEFLKLDWKDWWMDHDSWTNDSDWTQYDWVVDTWIIDPDFTWWTEIVASSTWDNYWLPLFPDSINVANFEVYVYPNKDNKQAWKDYSPETNVSPYVRIKLKLSPSWKTKKKIRWKVPEFEINTTVSLTDIFSR